MGFSVEVVFSSMGIFSCFFLSFLLCILCSMVSYLFSIAQVMSLNPLVVLVNDDFVVRFSSEKYVHGDYENSRVHLTNSAINFASDSGKEAPPSAASLAAGVTARRSEPAKPVDDWAMRHIERLFKYVLQRFLQNYCRLHEESMIFYFVSFDSFRTLYKISFRGQVYKHYLDVIERTLRMLPPSGNDFVVFSSFLSFEESTPVLPTIFLSFFFFFSACVCVCNNSLFPFLCMHRRKSVWLSLLSSFSYFWTTVFVYLLFLWTLVCWIHSFFFPPISAQPIAITPMNFSDSISCLMINSVLIF